MYWITHTATVKGLNGVKVKLCDSGWLHVSIRKKINTFSNLNFLIRTSLRTESD